MLPPGPATELIAPIYGQAPCFTVISSTTGGACSGLDTYAGQHIRIVKLVWGILIMTSILQPAAEALSSSSSAATLDQDSADDYPKIGVSTCGDPAEEGCHIIMVPPPRLEALLRTASTDIPPSENQKRPMLRRPMIE
jgi:hypothetical protein